MSDLPDPADVRIIGRRVGEYESIDTDLNQWIDDHPDAANSASDEAAHELSLDR